MLAAVTRVLIAMLRARDMLTPERSSTRMISRPEEFKTQVNSSGHKAMGVQEYENSPGWAGLSAREAGRTNRHQLRQFAGRVGASGPFTESSSLNHSCHVTENNLFLVLDQRLSCCFRNIATYASHPSY